MEREEHITMSLLSSSYKWPIRGLTLIGLHWTSVWEFHRADNRFLEMVYNHVQMGWCPFSLGLSCSYFFRKEWRIGADKALLCFEMANSKLLQCSHGCYIIIWIWRLMLSSFKTSNIHSISLLFRFFSGKFP